MSFSEDFDFYGDLVTSNRTLKLLRADNAPLIMAFLKNIFQNESEVDYIEAREKLNEFLGELRRNAAGDSDDGVSATAYFREWIRNGWIRELNNRLTMTDAAQKALSTCNMLNSRIVSTSATHLQILQTEIQKLFIQLSSDKKERIRELRARKKEIEDEIELIRSGRDTELSPQEQREKIRAVYDLASRLPEDFRRLEEESRDADKQIRIRISESRYTKGEILSTVLQDERKQRLTDYGAAYEGFMTLLSDKTTTDNFVRQLQSILDKPVARNLTDEQQYFLRNLVDRLNFESSRVIRIRQRIDENIRMYVESAGFEENRLMSKTLRKLEKLALLMKNVTDVNLTRAEINLCIENSDVTVNSVEGILLREPVGLIDNGSPEVHENSRELSPDVLGMLDTVRLRDIRERVTRGLRSRRGEVSVAEIISENTVRYGLQEVVAYVRIFHEMKARVIPDVYDEIEVADNRNRGRRLRIRLPRQVTDAGI